MTSLWIRVDAHKGDSVEIANVANALRIEPYAALGLYTALGGKVAQHTSDGLIADVADAMLEKWAGWTGKKGDFARAVREFLQDGEGRYDNWLETMGQLVDRRAKDRKRVSDRRRKDRGQSADGSQTSLGLSADTPPTDRGQSAATVRDGTRRDVTATTTERPTPKPAAPASAGSDGIAGRTTFNDVMLLVEERLYTPDGLPPAGWTEAQDGAILKHLHHTLGLTYDAIAAAVGGLAILRDHPGKYADVVEWLRPGEKITLRALYQDSGLMPAFSIATQAFWKHFNLSEARS